MSKRSELDKWAEVAPKAALIEYFHRLVRNTENFPHKRKWQDAGHSVTVRKVLSDKPEAFGRTTPRVVRFHFCAASEKKGLA